MNNTTEHGIREELKREYIRGNIISKKETYEQFIERKLIKVISGIRKVANADEYELKDGVCQDVSICPLCGDERFNPQDGTCLNLDCDYSFI